MPIPQNWSRFREDLLSYYDNYSKVNFHLIDYSDEDNVMRIFDKSISNVNFLNAVEFLIECETLYSMFENEIKNLEILLVSTEYGSETYYSLSKRLYQIQCLRYFWDRDDYDENSSDASWDNFDDTLIFGPETEDIKKEYLFNQLKITIDLVKGKGKVIVYQNDNELFSFQADEVFIGRDIDYFEVQEEKNFGNTILLREGDYYYYIGAEKFWKFKTQYPIVKYSSYINDDSDYLDPLPVAEDKNGNIYHFFYEKVIVNDGKNIIRPKYRKGYEGWTLFNEENTPFTKFNKFVKDFSIIYRRSRTKKTQ